MSIFTSLIPPILFSLYHSVLTFSYRHEKTITENYEEYFKPFPYNIGTPENNFELYKMFNISGYPNGVLKSCLPYLQKDISVALNILENLKPCMPMSTSFRLESLQNFLQVIDIQIMDKSLTDGQYLLTYSFITYLLTSLTYAGVQSAADEIYLFIDLYNYLGTPDLSFNGSSNAFLRNSRICLNSNSAYLDLKKLIPQASASYNDSNVLYYDKFWNMPTKSVQYTTTYPEFEHHFYYSKIGIFCVGVTLIGVYFFYKNQ